MANGVTFDTHTFVTDMTAAKMPTKQAELLAKTYSNFLNDRLVTKSELRSELERFEARLWVKVVGLHLATAGTMTAIILAAIRFWN